MPQHGQSCRISVSVATFQKAFWIPARLTTSLAIRRYNCVRFNSRDRFTNSHTVNRLNPSDYASSSSCTACRWASSPSATTLSSVPYSNTRKLCENKQRGWTLLPSEPTVMPTLHLLRSELLRSPFATLLSGPLCGLPMPQSSLRHVLNDYIITNSYNFTCIWIIKGLLGDQSSITPLVTILPALIAKSASICNPVVYAISHPKFRMV